MIRAAAQQVEARIFIEKALTDKKLRDRLDPAFAGRCQDLLDRRTRDMLRAVSTLVQTDDSWANSPVMWWQTPGIIGAEYYLSTDWQRSAEDLFNAAAEVEKAIGPGDGVPGP